MVATLIVPGLNGSAEGHWQRHWARDHASASIVRQSSWSKPVLREWLANLETAVERAGEAWLVTHSLGCLLAANLARRPIASRVKGALLVAPCDLERTTRLHPGIIDFGAMPDTPLPFPTIAVGSRNDPYMAFEQLHRIAFFWGSDVVDLGYAGHINIASGFGRWEQGYDLFAALAAKADQRNVRRPAARPLEVLFGTLH
jgi:predicted alpha/beta hydrolase family esterase